MGKRDFWNDKRFMKITASIFLLAVFLCFSFWSHSSEITFEDEKVGGTEGAGSAEEDDAGEREVIFVDISGCVVNPGVYQLSADSRMFQAIDAAGGLTDEAEIRSVNRAELLKDEQVIVVLSRKEYEERQAALKSGTGYADGKVNLNSADSKALETLSGVGPSTAQRILEYREAHGSFQKIEDLMNVSGIGEKTFEKLKDDICVQ